MPPRIFISSVVRGFEEYREAAQRGVTAAGCEAVLAEETPARADTPRNACLDLVESSDAYIGVLGSRAGHTAASGKTVVEEEFEHAQRMNKPTLILLQEDVEREDRQQEFVGRVSGYEFGRFRQSFRTAEELERKVREALEDLDVGTNENREAACEEAMAALGRRLIQNEPTVRLAIAPVRIEEVIDVRVLQDRQFFNRLLEIGRSGEVELLDPATGYDRAVDRNSLRITAQGRTIWNEPHQVAAIELTEQGRLLVETNATRVTSVRRWLNPMIVEEIRLQLRRAFRFASAVYDEADPGERHQQFVYNAGLSNTGSMPLLEQPPASDSPITMARTDHAAAYEQPRDVSRAQLRQPHDEIGRVLARFRLELNHGY